MSGLFGDAPAPKRKRVKKPAGESDGVVNRLFDVYLDAFRRKWNIFDSAGKVIEPEIKPLIQRGRDHKHLKDMAAAWGEEEVAQLIQDFFASTDPQVVRSDYKIAVLFREAQRLRLQRSRRAPVNDERTVSNIDAARRATRSR